MMPMTQCRGRDSRCRQFTAWVGIAGLLAGVLAGSVRAGEPVEAGPARLEVRAPVEWQVVQRGDDGRGVVQFRGTVRGGADAVEARLEGGSIDNGLGGGWQAMRLDRQAGSFAGEAVLPGGGWYRCEVRVLAQGKVLASASIPHVGVGEVFVVAGQSNAANHGSERQQASSGFVVAFDGTRWQPCADPQPGASGGGGSFLPAFGDALHARLKVPIAVVALAAGGTSVREWLPGGDRMTNAPSTGANVRAVGPGEYEATGELFARLLSRLESLGPRGCRAVLWHQGESDGNQAGWLRQNGQPLDRVITGEQYAAFLRRLVTASRERAGWEVPWMVAQTTYHSEVEPVSEEIRAAQRSMWTSGLALKGPDTDALRVPYRDGVHFNGDGLRRHGELWAERVTAWLRASGRERP